MTMKTEPFLSGKYGWDLGESDWKDGADENFLKFSYMLNGNVDSFVATLPVSPLDGDAVFLTSDNTLNARVDGAWYKYSPPKNFVITEKITGLKYVWNGSTVVSTVGPADKIKIDAVASGATANATNAELRDRTTHTGFQAISTVTGLQTALNLKADLVSPTFTGTPIAPTPSTADDSTKLATTAFVKAQEYLTADSPDLVTTVNGEIGPDVVLTKTHISLSNVDNTADTAKPVSTAQQTALNLKSNIASPTFTGTVVLPSTTSIGTVSNTEISYLDGVSSSIQGQIDAITGVTGGYAPLASPTFTGTVGGITKAMVGLGNVDNTSDVSKPVSTAQQTALNLKANVANPLFTGNITGDFSSAAGTRVALQSTTANSITSITAIPNGTSTQTRFQARNNSDAANSSVIELFANATDGGISSGFNGTGAYLPLNIITGGVARVGISTSGVVTLPSTTIIGNVDATEISYLDGVTSSIQTQINTKAPIVNPSFTGNAISLDAASGQASLYLTQAGVNNGRVWAGGGAGTDINISSGRFIGMFPTNDFVISYAGSTKFSVPASGVVTAADASGLANLNASNIASGTVAIARLPYTFSSSSSVSTGVLRDGSGDIYGNGFTGASLNIVGIAPNTVNRDTNNLVATMTGYTSYQDSSATEVGWLGYATGNGEFGISNGVRNIRFISPVVTNGDLSVLGNTAVTGTLSASSFSGNGAGLTSLTYSQLSFTPVQQGGGIGQSTNKVYVGWSSSGLKVTIDATDLGRVMIDSASNIISDWNSISETSSGCVSLSLGASNRPASIPDSYYKVFFGEYGAGVGIAVDAVSGKAYGFRKSSNTFTVSDWLSTTSSLNASNISSGTLATARLPFSYGSTNTSSTVVQRDSGGGFSAGAIAATFVGDGANIHSLNASQLTIGTVSNSRLNVASTSGYGITQLVDSTSSTSTTMAATPASVKAAYDFTTSVNATLSSLSTSFTSLVNTPKQTFQSLTANGATSITAASGMHVLANCTGNTTWTFPSPSASEVHALTIELTNGGAFTQTWPATTRWAGGVAPINSSTGLTVSGTDILVFTKAGTNNWRGYLSSKDSK